jgi:hypothetical protein
MSVASERLGAEPSCPLDRSDARRRDRLVDDLMAPKHTHRSDSRVFLEPKLDIKKRTERSPDFGMR